MRAASSLRAPWFHVSCCPTNVARTLASLHGYVATADDGGIQIHQLMPATIRTDDVELRVITGYPWSDEVVVRVEKTPSSPWRLSVRVPSWAHEAVLVDRGHRRPVKSGYAVVDATFKPGDEVRLELPMQPRWTHPDPHVDAVRGCVAVERGPIVYCLESTDQDDGVSLAEVSADASNGLADHGAGRQPRGRHTRSRRRQHLRRTARRSHVHPLPRVGQPRAVDDARLGPRGLSVPTQCSGTPIRERIAIVAHDELRIEGRLRVVEVTGAWGAYAGERIIIGGGESFRDDLGIKIRETFESGAADALAEGRSPSEQFELPNVRITIEVVPPDTG